MSGLLFGIGAVAFVVGAAMIGFGIPINEFSFGNTLIIAGITAAVGGLIVIGLGVVVAQLQRIAAVLATRAPSRSGRPLDMVESAAGSRAAPAPSRMPFPPKQKSDAGVREPHLPEFRTGASMPVEDGPPQSFAPSLRNPDEAPVTVEDEVSLSPQHPMAAPAQTRQPPAAYFDAMWPAGPKPAKNPVDKGPADTEAKPYEPRLDPSLGEPAAASARRAEPESPKPRPANEPRAVAILKSGVVDGMGYTLYVDGSIEAELPQGTLRFASINELRSHLEKNA